MIRFLLRWTFLSIVLTVPAEAQISGGVSQIIAGSGVEVSPANGTGKVTVSSTSGGGNVSASGTVTNGQCATFTGTGYDVIGSSCGGGGSVSSVFTRTGAVTAQSGDYASFYGQLSATNAWSGINTWTGPSYFSNSLSSGSVPADSIAILGNGGYLDTASAGTGLITTFSGDGLLLMGNGGGGTSCDVSLWSGTMGSPSACVLGNGNLSVTNGLRLSGVTTGTPAVALCRDSTGIVVTNGASSNCFAGGSGTVNSGTAGQIAYYASSGTAVSGTTALPSGTTATTQSVGTNNTTVANTAFVQAFIPPQNVNVYSTATYTFASTDAGHLLPFGGSGCSVARTWTLPPATTSGFGVGFQAGVTNSCAADLTINSTSTMGGLSSVVIPPNKQCWFVTDSTGANYVLDSCTALSASIGANADITSLTGLTTPLSIAQGGTGAASTSQNFFFAGPTSGSGAPAFRAIAAGDLPLATTSAFGAVKCDGTTITCTAGVIAATGGGGSFLPLTGGTLTTTGVTAPLVGSQVLNVAQDGASSVINVAVGGSSVTPAFQCQNVGGTLESPTATPSGATICQLGILGYDGTTAKGASFLQVMATAQWSGSTNEELVRLRSVPKNTLTAGVQTELQMQNGIFVGSSGSPTFEGNGTVNAGGYWADSIPVISATGALIGNGVLPTPATGTLAIGGTTTAPTMGATAEGAIWLTATGGLNLIGDGSTNDFTVLNKTGATVISIPTGTTTTTFAGQTTTTAQSTAREFTTTSTLTTGSGMGLAATNTVGLYTNTVAREEWDANGHPILINNGTPGAPTSCGTGSPSVSGTDAKGVITTGTAATACTMAFGATWGATPVCVVSSSSAVSVVGISAISTTSVTFTIGTALTGSLYYICEQ